MIIINTKASIDNLSNDTTIDKRLLLELNAQFTKLYKKHGNSIPIDQFRLDCYGEIILIELTDNLSDLPQIGFGKETGGLFTANIENAEILLFHPLIDEEKIQVYHATIFHNRKSINIFAPADALDSESIEFFDLNI